MSPEVKAIVLLELIQQHYLEEHICDPGRYFPFLKRKKILSQAECCSIRQQQCFEYQLQKFVELISLKEDGYDMFVEALRNQKVNAEVAAHLRKRVSEVDELYSQGEWLKDGQLVSFNLSLTGQGSPSLLLLPTGNQLPLMALPLNTSLQRGSESVPPD